MASAADLREKAARLRALLCGVSDFAASASIRAMIEELESQAKEMDKLHEQAALARRLVRGVSSEAGRRSLTELADQLEAEAAALGENRGRAPC